MRRSAGSAPNIPCLLKLLQHSFAVDIYIDADEQIL
jgi:hypothetical protein